MARPSAACHPDREHVAFGLCKPCWREQYRSRPEVAAQEKKAQARRSRARRLEWKKWLAGQKARPCDDCGGGFAPCVMDFHHLDAATKEFEIGKATNRRRLDVEREMVKCVLLCANCHRLRENGDEAGAQPLYPQVRGVMHVSERRTAEIKFRTTPSTKAAWQAAAEEEGITLTEMIERSVNTRTPPRRALEEPEWLQPDTLKVDAGSFKPNLISMTAENAGCTYTSAPAEPPVVAELRQLRERAVDPSPPPASDAPLSPTLGGRTIDVGTPVEGGIVRVGDIIRSRVTGEVIPVVSKDNAEPAGPAWCSQLCKPWEFCACKAGA